MKKTILIFAVAVAAIAGYALGNFFPFRLSEATFVPGVDKGIRGDTQVLITAIMEDRGNPVPNLEIDVAPQPGEPPPGGVALTNEDGVAEFHIQPGNYFIYFNQSNFPRNLKMPEPEPLTVIEGAVNKKEVHFFLLD